jgi:hypothetical protein
MKKVMFTAIALIAFSSVSMGNTIAEEKVVNLDNKKEVTIKTTDCNKFAIHITNACEELNGECLTPTEYNQYIRYWTGFCIAMLAFAE